ncbi:family 43 glycosylhydrolase [Paenibacillus sp. CAU 1782]
MKKALSLMVIIALISTIFASIASADNPVVQTIYTADPAPIVYNDTVYLYTGHDLDIATNSYKMFDWRVFSTTDMVNWTDHGAVLDVTAFSWANQTQDANASHVIHRNGKFYYFVSVASAIPGKGGIALGVAVADSPTGPFVDAIGAPLVTNDMTKYAAHSWDDLDPAVFIDDDGQAYLYWGNNALYYAKLNEDMISLDGPITAVPLTTEAFGPDFEEAPWVYKRDGLYYLIYASGFPESIHYSTSDSPTGPWSYRGVIMPRQGGSSTNHPGIIEYKGESYFFYHNDSLPGGGSYKRSVAVERFSYNADGTIPTFGMTTAGIDKSIDPLDPYTRTEAETIAWASGVKTEPLSQGGRNVTDIHNGDYIKVKDVDFGSIGAATFTAQVASASGGGAIELRLDSADGPLVGSLPVAGTGGETGWLPKTTSVSGAAGIHDLFFVFRGPPTGELFKFDYWQFGSKSDKRELAAIHASLDKPKIDSASGANTAALKVMAVYTDGTSQDVTAQAVAVPVQNGIVSVADGIVTGTGYGAATINVSYGGKSDAVFILVKDLDSELTVKSITIDNASFVLDAGRSGTFKVTAEYADGHVEDVTGRATYTNNSPEVADVSGGTVTAKASGSTRVTVSFKGERGETASAVINVTVHVPAVMALEAEAAADNTENAYVQGVANGHTWTLVDGQSTKAMQFLPDDGITVTVGTDAASLAAGSKLGYKINVPRSGSYQLWILAKSRNFQTDSVHVGLNNAYQFTSNGIQNVSAGQFRWVNLSNGGTAVTGGSPLSLTAGEHELNFWGRESGLAIDRIYLTTSNSTTDPVWPPVEPQGPAAALSGDGSVKPGSSFTVAVSLNNVTDRVYAGDIELIYDADVFQYVSAAGAGEHTQIVKEDKETAGKVRLLAAHIGGISGAGTPVLNLTFKVKDGVQNTTGTIGVAKASLGVGPEGTVVQAALGSKTIAVGSPDVVIDKGALTAAIEKAQELHDAAVAGSLPGQYPQAAKDDLGKAIAAAKAVKDNANATQAQVDSATVALTGAIDTFNEAVIKEASADLNNDGIVNVGDLAMAAYHYGKDSASTDWQDAQIADMNKDGKIDILDLSYVASKMLL